MFVMWTQELIKQQRFLNNSSLEETQVSSKQNPDEIIVDFNLREIKNNEVVEEAKPKPKAKRASTKK